MLLACCLRLDSHLSLAQMVPERILPFLPLLIIYLLENSGVYINNTWWHEVRMLFSRDLSVEIYFGKILLCNWSFVINLL